MSYWHVRVLLIVLVAVTLAVSVIASDSGQAIVRTVGDVSTNGSPAGRVSALSSRDVVETAIAGNAVITAKGTIIRVLPNSKIIYGELIELQAGAVEIGTKSGLIVTVDNYRIVPVQKNAKFTVASKKGCSHVSVQEGSVTLAGDSTNRTVSTGSLSSFGKHSCEISGTGVRTGKKATRISGSKAAVLGGTGAAAVVIGSRLVQHCSPSSPD